MKLPNLNTGYFRLIALLIIPFALLAMHSFSEQEFQICGMTLEKCDRMFPLPDTTPPTSVDSLSEGLDSLTVMTDTLVIDEQPDTLSHRILFFGDSMVEGLSKRMGEYAKANDHQLMNIIWYSSSTEIWAKSDTLKHFIQSFRPTYVMISIGGNELFVRDLNKREKYIHTIIEKIGDIPYVWIGPPNWKEDTGINDLIRESVSTSRFFLSKNLSFERSSDKIHPTFASASVWMDTIASWMASCNCIHPIKMKCPTVKVKTGKTIMLAPPTN